MKKTVQFIWSNLELLFWVTALVYLFFINPVGTHFTFCPIKNLGFNFCPGCGLGHSIHYAMTLNIRESFSHHPLGFFALLVLLSRIFKLIRNLFKTQYYEFKTFTNDSGH